MNHLHSEIAAINAAASAQEAISRKLIQANKEAANTLLMRILASMPDVEVARTSSTKESHE